MKQRPFSRILAASLIVLCILSQTGCAGKETAVSGTDFLLNTVCKVDIYEGGGSRKEQEELIEKVFDLCREYENRLSRTIPGSDVYRLNHAEGEPVAVHETTIEVIEAGIRYGQLSGGRFDITVGRLSELWDFSGQASSVPDADAIFEAVSHVDYQKIRIWPVKDDKRTEGREPEDQESALVWQGKAATSQSEAKTRQKETALWQDAQVPKAGKQGPETSIRPTQELGDEDRLQRDTTDDTLQNGKEIVRAEAKSAVVPTDVVSTGVQKNEVQLLDVGAKLDLGGIAKGYIADQAADYLRESGVTSAVLNFGGNIVTIGTKREDVPFTIGIERPFSAEEEGQKEILGTIDLSDGSVVTSGTYERKFYEDGILYHHILDPKTGYPAETDLDGVSIVGPSSVDCDGLSTSCLMLGLEKGKKLIDNLDGYEAIFVTKERQVVVTEGLEFRELVR